ncbi:MFS transporter [Microbacterium sp. 18062]|uniref:MFS transporter n=1 Tax=Microbacterium sp. 18062 TaxID=2681410 RepID=UPI0013586F02|nr:MFS transporter [Microbacterium sp. 18062]
MTTSTARRRTSASPLISGSFGNFVEWYDWGIFAVLATVFSAQIFHAGSDIAALLQTLTTFAVGFAARPLGAVLLSPLGDRIGRKRLLSLAILMMAGGSLVLGLTPGYAVIGIVSPVIFVAARIVQGLSAGAEFQAGSSYIVEHAPEHKRGLFGSVTLMSSIAGTLAATATGAIVTTVFDAETLALWGWRIPFIIGALLGLIGLYLRTRAPETEAFQKIAGTDAIVQSPLREVFTHHKLTMLRIFAISVYTGAYYLWTVFLPTYAHLASGLPLQQTLLGGIISLIVMFIALPFLGRLSDKIGRKPMLLAHCVGMALLAYPMLRLLEIPSFGVFLAVDIVGCLIVGFTSATQSATYCELTPANVRTTAMGIPYNLSSALVGGTMPLIATALVTSGNGQAVAFIIIGIAVFAGIVIAFMPEVRGRDLNAVALRSRDRAVA